MYAVEFETDIKDKYIEIPDYQFFKNKHAKVILMTSEPIKTHDPAATNNKKLLNELKEWGKDGITIPEGINLDDLINEMNA